MKTIKEKIKIMKTITPIIKMLKTLVLTIVFLFICQTSFGQTNNNNTQAIDTANALFVKPSTHAVTIVKISEEVVSTPSRDGSIKYFDRNGIGQKVYIQEEEKAAIILPAAKDEIEPSVPPNTTVPK